MSSQSTLRYYDEQDYDNSSNLMAKKFRSTSVLSKYKHLCSHIPVKEMPSALIQLTKDAQKSVKLTNALSEQNMNTIRYVKSMSRGNKAQKQDMSRGTIEPSSSSISYVTKTTESRFRNVPQIIVQRTVSNYSGMSLFSIYIANQWLQRRKSGGKMEDDSRMIKSARQENAIKHSEFGIQAFKRKHNGADK